MNLSENNDSLSELSKIDILSLMTPTNPQSCQITDNAISEDNKNTIITVFINLKSDNDMLSSPSDKNVSENKEVYTKQNHKALVHFNDSVNSSTKESLSKVNKKSNLIINSSKHNVSAKYTEFSMLLYAFHIGADNDDTHLESDFTSNIFKKAVSCLESEFWKQSMQFKLQSYVNNSIYSLVSHSSVSSDVDVISLHWVYKKKKDLQDNTVKYKTHWCAHKFTQEYNINYEETFASVIKSVIFKLIFSKTALKDLELEQINMITAFLNSLVKNSLVIYVKQPSEYKKENDQVCLLFKTLYDLK